MSTTPEQVEEAEQTVDESTPTQCTKDLEEYHAVKVEEPIRQAEAEAAATTGAVELPFESFLADGSLPARPISFIEETYEMRYLADYPSPGDDMWV